MEIYIEKNFSLCEPLPRANGVCKHSVYLQRFEIREWNGLNKKFQYRLEAERGNAPEGRVSERSPCSLIQGGAREADSAILMTIPNHSSDDHP